MGVSFEFYLDVGDSSDHSDACNDSFESLENDLIGVCKQLLFPTLIPKKLSDRPRQQAWQPSAAQAFPLFSPVT